MAEREGKDQASFEGRNEYFMDIDRMVNEGLGSGLVTDHNGLIGDTTTDTMAEPESSYENRRTDAMEEAQASPVRDITDEDV